MAHYTPTPVKGAMHELLHRSDSLGNRSSIRLVPFLRTEVVEVWGFAARDGIAAASPAWTYRWETDMPHLDQEGWLELSRKERRIAPRSQAFETHRATSRGCFLPIEAFQSHAKKFSVLTFESMEVSKVSTGEKDHSSKGCSQRAVAVREQWSLLHSHPTALPPLLIWLGNKMTAERKQSQFPSDDAKWLLSMGNSMLSIRNHRLTWRA